MKIRATLILTVILAAALVCAAQTKPKTIAPAASPVKASPAFAEVLLHKTELTAELESLLLDYTEEYPKVKRLRTEIGLIQKEIDRLLAVPAEDAGRLSVALGKLMIRKVQSATELWSLRLEYNDEHPDVKAIHKKVDVFEAAIREILR